MDWSLYDSAHWCFNASVTVENEQGSSRGILLCFLHVTIHSLNAHLEISNAKFL
jgi:hypothetical protein